MEMLLLQAPLKLLEAVIVILLVSRLGVNLLDFFLLSKSAVEIYIYFEES